MIHRVDCITPAFNMQSPDASSVDKNELKVVTSNALTPVKTEMGEGEVLVVLNPRNNVNVPSLTVC